MRTSPPESNWKTSDAYRTVQRAIAKLFPWEAAASSACINHLRQIDGAKQQWALENRRPAGAVPTFSDLAPYMGRGTAQALALRCPQSAPTNNFLSSYTIGAVSNPPQCKIMPAPGGHTLQ